MKKLFIILLLLVSNIYAWEVTTHRAIDRISLGSVQNLDYFVSDSGVDSESLWK